MAIENAVAGVNTFAALIDVIEIQKPIDETINNNAVLQNDDDLFFAAAVNEVWELTYKLQVWQGINPGFQYAIVVPAGAVIIIHGRYSEDFTSGGILYAVTASGGSAGFTPPVGTVKMIVILDVLVKMGGTAGNIQPQWAQNVATAVNTTVKAGSSLIAHQL